MRLFRSLRSLLLLVFFVMLVFPVLGGGTKIVQRWVSPDVAKYQFDHVLTSIIIKDPTTPATGGRRHGCSVREREMPSLPTASFKKQPELRDKEHAEEADSLRWDLTEPWLCVHFGLKTALPMFQDPIRPTMAVSGAIIYDYAWPSLHVAGLCLHRQDCPG